MFVELAKIEVGIARRKLARIETVNIMARKDTEKMMEFDAILCIETDDARMMLNMGTWHEPIGNVDILHAIYEALSSRGITQYNLDRIQNIILSCDDGEKETVYGIEIAKVWPNSFDCHKKEQFYNPEGGEK